MARLETKNPEELNKILNDAWLGHVFNEATLFNPLENIPKIVEEDPHLYYSYLLSRPEYFYFTCSQLFNVKLLPIQAVILQEMWKHKFPMLIGTRGLGKAISPDELIRVKNGWKKIKDIEKGDFVFNSDGNLVEVIFKTELQENLNFYKITFEDGRFIECCEDHLWSVVNNETGFTHTLKTSELIENKYSVPLCKNIEDDQECPIHPYLLGILIAKFHINGHKVYINTSKDNCVLTIDNLLPEGYKLRKENYSKEDKYYVHRVDKTLPTFKKYIESFGIDYSNISERRIPEKYKFIGSYAKNQFVNGLIASTSNENNQIEVNHLPLANDILDFVRSAGLYCVLKKDKKYIIEIDYTKKTNTITSIEFVGKKPGICISVDGTNKTYITKDYIVTHNTFLLAVYILLRLLLIPGRKMVIAGASFRQSKLVYEYCNSIWANAPLLRNAVGPHGGPKGGNDAVYFHIGDSKATFVPIGCLSADTLVTTDYGIRTIKSLENNYSKIYGKEKYRKVDRFYNNGVNKAIKITTESGFQYIGTPDHMMLAVVNGNIKWKQTQDMKVSNRILIDRTERWFENTVDTDPYEAYMVGYMFGAANISKTDEKVKILNDLINKYETQEKWNSYWQVTDPNMIPGRILSSKKEIMVEFLRGLFDSRCNILTVKNSNNICLRLKGKYCFKQIQYILLHFGIISKIKKDFLYIFGQNIFKFNEKIGFSIKEKNDKVKYHIDNRKKNINTDHIPVNKQFTPKTLINRYKSVTFNNVKKFDFSKKSENIKALINENYFYDKIKKIEQCQDQNMYDIHVPEDNIYCANGFYSHNSGGTIRGLRGDVACDEFASHNKEIFENVLSGFGAVSSSPQDKVKEYARKKLSLQLGSEVLEEEDYFQNQIIISGTAYYYFNHFAEYWEKWKKIIYSQGDEQKLLDIYPEGPPKGFNWKDYCVLRIPYNLIPEGYMDEGNLARSRGTLNSSLFMMEFEAVFPKDSDGFFKASLVESCVPSHTNVIEKPSGEIFFNPMLSGSSNKQYYMGVDTASQVDNFAIVILEVWPDHRRIVYCWTTNAKDFKEKRKQGKVNETDFYRYCSSKIRELMLRFNIACIAIDSQGGGRAIYESLHDKSSLKQGEQMIWERFEEGKKKDSDLEEGLHIVDMVNFAKSEYLSSANHGLRKDFEDKNCVFPVYNPALTEAFVETFGEEMEQLIEDIQELKVELARIELTLTANGRERFDTPDAKNNVSDKGRYKKDRYSALLMANMSARTDYHLENDYTIKSINTLAEKSAESSAAKFVGPDWLVSQYEDLY